MHKNKALQVAMAAALSLGVAVAQAGTLKLVAAIPTTDVASATDVGIANLKYAYEQFGSKDALAYTYRTVYGFASNMASINNDFYATFTLSDNASFFTNLYQVQAFKIYKQGGGLSTVPISRAAGGAAGEKTVTYLVQATKDAVVATDMLAFEFQVQQEGALTSPGGLINLTAQLNIAIGPNPTQGTALDTTQTIPIATSAEGLEVRIEGSTSAPEDGTAYISVEKDSKVFAGNAVLEEGTLIDYGRIILRAVTSKVLDKDSPAPLNSTLPAPIIWDPSTEFKKATFTIQDGNFNASGQPSDGNVYLAVDYNAGVTATDKDKRKVKANAFSDLKTARWDLTDVNLKDIYLTSNGAAPSRDPQPNAPDSNPNGVYIWLKVKGDTPIEEYRQAKPMGIFQLNMANMALPIQVSSELRHLKKNGTVCTLYNIPGPESAGKKPIDVFHIRMTNNSAIPNAFVKAKLRDTAGNQIYANSSTPPYETLIAPEDNFGPKQTRVLSLEDLTNPAGSENTYTWNSRGVLTVESNIPEPKLEVYLLLRPDNVQGARIGPLMNMSVGATGNSCD